MVETKQVVQSKTVWFNVVVAVATAITAIVPAFQEVLSVEIYGYLLIAVNGVNTVLRFVTDKKLV